MHLQPISALTAYREWKKTKKMCLETLRVLLQPIPFVKKSKNVSRNSSVLTACPVSSDIFENPFQSSKSKACVSLFIEYFLFIGDFTTVPSHSNYVPMNPPLGGLLSLKRGKSDLRALSSSFVYDLWKEVSKMLLQMG